MCKEYFMYINYSANIFGKMRYFILKFVNIYMCSPT